MSPDLPAVRAAFAEEVWAWSRVAPSRAHNRETLIDAILATLSDPAVVEELLAHWFGENPHNMMLDGRERLIRELEARLAATEAVARRFRDGWQEQSGQWWQSSEARWRPMSDVERQVLDRLNEPSPE